MPGLVPGIHVFHSFNAMQSWMAGTSPAMTVLQGYEENLAGYCGGLLE